MSAQEQYTDYLLARINALESELEKAQKTLSEISEISTIKSRDIKVLISDPNFNKPLSELEKQY